MLALVLVSWVSARAMLWENPFPAFDPYAPIIGDWIAKDKPQEKRRVAQNAPTRTSNSPTLVRVNPGRFDSAYSPVSTALDEQPFVTARAAKPIGASGASGSEATQMSLGHRLLFSKAFSRAELPQMAHIVLGESQSGLGFARMDALAADAPWQAQAALREDRWSFDSWAFLRQGSNSLNSSQGRAPVYGASQLGATLQYRLAPTSSHDHKAYIRAYRALVSGGETELAVGLAARPVPSVPVRVQVEARLTNNAFGTELRPAIIAITELRAQKLPVGLKAETYAQGGYVGGAADTGFVEGQVAVTREVKNFDLSVTKSARLSVGAAAWGGAQRDAQRIDLGPSVRLDLAIGEVPARVSVDWRERVAGDAEPGSGVAATISTRF